MNLALNYYLTLTYPYLLISFKVVRTVYFSRLIKMNKKTSFSESSVCEIYYASAKNVTVSTLKMFTSVSY